MTSRGREAESEEREAEASPELHRTSCVPSRKKELCKQDDSDGWVEEERTQTPPPPPLPLDACCYTRTLFEAPFGVSGFGISDDEDEAPLSCCCQVTCVRAKKR